MKLLPITVIFSSYVCSSEVSFSACAWPSYAFSFLSAWHIFYFTWFFTLETNVLAGLKEGMLCEGIIMVVFFEILRAVSQLFF